MKWFLAVLAAILLTACGQLPRPFQAEEGQTNALLKLKNRGGVLVLPVGGLGCGATTAEAMAEALQQRDLIASTEFHNADSFMLACLADPGGGEDGPLITRWRLFDQDSQEIGRHSQPHSLSRQSWNLESAAAIQRVVAEAVEPVIAMILTQGQALPAATRASQRQLAVLPFTAGPGDSRRALPRAMARELAAAAFPISSEPGQGDLLISGAVTLSIPVDGWQQATIVWTVTQARDGVVLGQVTQENRVPAGSLDVPWGPLAGQIARAATPGLIELIEQTKKL